MLPRLLDDTVAELEQHDPARQRQWAQRTAAALAALQAYAVAKRPADGKKFNGNFHTFCTFSGAGISPHLVKMNESAMLMGHAMGEKRCFPVSEQVAPEGIIAMEAHVCLQKVGSPAPRLYFHDDTLGATGQVHVGYIGEHLANFRTRRM